MKADLKIIWEFLRRSGDKSSRGILVLCMVPSYLSPQPSRAEVVVSDGNGDLWYLVVLILAQISDNELSRIFASMIRHYRVDRSEVVVENVWRVSLSDRGFVAITEQSEGLFPGFLWSLPDISLAHVTHFSTLPCRHMVRCSRNWVKGESKEKSGLEVISFFG